MVYLHSTCQPNLTISVAKSILNARAFCSSIMVVNFCLNSRIAGVLAKHCTANARATACGNRGDRDLESVRASGTVTWKDPRPRHQRAPLDQQCLKRWKSCSARLHARWDPQTPTRERDSQIGGQVWRGEIGRTRRRARSWLKTYQVWTVLPGTVSASHSQS